MKKKLPYRLMTQQIAKDVMQKNNLTQVKAAKLCGVSQCAFSKYINAKSVARSNHFVEMCMHSSKSLQSYVDTFIHNHKSIK